MSGSHAEDPGLPRDYFAKRWKRLDRRGDIVREYKEVAEELHASFVSDIRAGRKRAAVVHFRPFAEYCVNCLFVAYSSSEHELDRRSLPQNAFRTVKRVIQHWQIPVDNGDMKKLEKMYHDLSQTVHGRWEGLENFNSVCEDWIPSAEKVAQMLMKCAEEADRRLNGHRDRLNFRCLMRRIGVSDRAEGAFERDA